MSRHPATPDATPKACPACKKTTIRVYSHNITAWTDAQTPAEPNAWQCVYCGAVFDRTGGSGTLVVCGYGRVVLAPGELNELCTYQSRRNKEELPT